jgi:ferrochelatase
MPNSTRSYDAVILVSFGGPEGHDEVMPFLDNVLRGRNVPEARKLEVAQHYYHFDGASPINQLNRELIAALEHELVDRNIRLPIYFGNRNWHPLLADTVQDMRSDGVCRALALVTSAFGSWSGCRQYQDDIDRACAEVSGAPAIDKLPLFGQRAGFAEAVAARVAAACDVLAGTEARVVFTAHSVPCSMADCGPYKQQLVDACEEVARRLQLPCWDLVYQSRSGPPSQPWLEPDICDHLRSLAGDGVSAVVVQPIGFISDHLEVLFDLDVEARGLCDELGMQFARAATVGTHAAFVKALADHVAEALEAGAVTGCRSDCCDYGSGR